MSAAFFVTGTGTDTLLVDREPAKPVAMELL